MSKQLNLPAILKRASIAAFVNEYRGIAPAGASLFRINDVDFTLTDFNRVADELGWRDGKQTILPTDLVALPSALLRARFSFRRCSDTLLPNLWFVLYTDEHNETHAIAEAGSKEDAILGMEEAARQCLNATLSYFNPAWSLSTEATRKLINDYKSLNSGNELSAWIVAEIALSTFTLTADMLTPVKGRSPNTFKKQVEEVHRPYLAIDDTVNAALEAGKTHYYRTPGGLAVTWGDATCFGSIKQYAIMPVQDSTVTRLIAANTKESA